MTPAINSVVLEEEKESVQEDNNSDYNEELKATSHDEHVYAYASFRWEPRYPDPGEEVTFISTSHASYGHITHEKWKFHDGYAEIGHSAKHTYEEKGSYKVTLEVRAVGMGGYDWDTRTSYVKIGADPFPRFTFTPEDPSPREEVTLDASTASDPDGQIMNYSWSYYNVKTPENVTYLGSKQVINYTWEKQGNYKIVLFVRVSFISRLYLYDTVCR